MRADARRIMTAGAALLWEQAWPRLVPILSVAAVYAALSLLDVPRHLPAWAHGGLLGVVVLAEGWLAIRLTRVRLPPRDEILRRIEVSSGLAHRPLTSKDDSQGTGTGDALSLAFWQAHKRHLKKAEAEARPLWPKPDLPAKDPWGLRAGALLVLVVGVVVAGPDAWPRLAYGVTPPLSVAGGEPQVEVWIAPPAATGLSPVRLDPTRTAVTVIVPQGTVVRATVPKGWGRANLQIGPDTAKFTDAEDGTQHAELTARQGETLAVRRLFRTVAEWRIAVVVDQPPQVAFLRPPGPTAMADGEIRIQSAVSAKDDWGLDKVWLEIKAEGLAVDLDPEKIELPLSGNRPRSVEIENRLEAQGSEFAGLTVSVVPKAQDGAGQIAEGPAQHFAWPEIPYADENAARLAQARKALLVDPSTSDDAIDTMGDVATAAGMPSVELALSLAMRDLTPPEFRPNEAQALMLESAAKLEKRAQARMGAALDQLGQDLDKAGGGKESQALAKRYADMIGAMLDRQSKGGASLPLSPGQMEDIRRRLDRLAAQPGNKDLAKRLEEMAQQMGQIMDGDKGRDRQQGQSGMQGNPPVGGVRRAKTPGARPALPGR